MGGVVPGVAADSQGRVFVGRRHPPALLVYDRDGAYIDTWGADLLGNPHLLWVDGEDQVYAADTDDHTIRCFNPQGGSGPHLGHAGRAGARPTSPLTSRPKPCAALLGICTWPTGTANTASTEFRTRESWSIRGDPRARVRVNSPCPTACGWTATSASGPLTAKTTASSALTPRAATWMSGTDLEMPMDLFITPDNTVYIVEAPSRVSIFDIEGQLLARWGEDGSAPGAIRRLSAQHLGGRGRLAVHRRSSHPAR